MAEKKILFLVIDDMKSPGFNESCYGGKEKKNGIPIILFHILSFLNEKKAKRVQKMYPCFP